MPSTSFAPLLWFVAIIVMIPIALWLLKRTPLGGGAASAAGMRVIAALPIAPNQRLLTVEVGQGEERRWLVLGVTPSSITTLHHLAPQAEPAPPAGPAGGPQPVSFAQVLGKLRRSGDAA